MTQQDNDRAAFEAWMQSIPKGHRSEHGVLSLQRNHKGTANERYMNQTVEKMFVAWQAAIAQDRQGRGEPVGWINEDELPDNYPYDDMYPFSKVDVVRLFPVFFPETVITTSYLDGHNDGLEWAARLAEANHPPTSDWLYDDPHDLAKAIRKGPEMPPADPVVKDDEYAKA